MPIRRALRSAPARVRVLAAAALVAGVAAAAPPAPAIRFRDVAGPWQIDFRHVRGGSGEFYMPETMGSGVALLDYDGDGDVDVFLVDSGAMPGYPGPVTGSRLYRNEGGGRFLDVTPGAGIEVRGYGMGVTAGDVDGDGFPDLYVTEFGDNQLFRNRGDGTFEDVTARAGVGDPAWSSSATFADLDGDGFLDLYVANYVDFTIATNRPCGDVPRGLRSYCHPNVYHGVPDTVYRNRGDGTFENVTAAWGFGGADGNGLGVLATDVDGDGRVDVYVANDMTANFLFHNLGGGRFEEIGLFSGAALGTRGEPEAGMGVDAADVDGDGRDDLVVTHLDLQTNALYCNRGEALFVDCRYPAGVAEASLYWVGFGVALADLDNDGRPDLAVANGHIIHNVEGFGTGTTYRQRNQILRNVGGRLVEIADSGLDAVRASRGLAVGDLSGDGRLDLVISNSDDLAEVYENVSPEAGSWLRVDLARSGGNRIAVGARVEIESDGGRQHREVRTGSSYQSQNETTLHFGLGAAQRVPRLVVRWPAGARSDLRDVPAGVRVRVAAPRAGAPAPR